MDQWIAAKALPEPECAVAQAFDAPHEVDRFAARQAVRMKPNPELTEFHRVFSPFVQTRWM
jgi:hypothetical protein